MGPDLTDHWRHLPQRPLHSLRPQSWPSRGPRLAVVPGLGAVAYLAAFVRACATWSRPELLDVPGFGHHATADLPASLSDCVSATVAWLASEPRLEEPVVLVGHSTGAQVALHAALALGQHVAAAVLLSPTFPPQARRWRSLTAAVLRTLPHERPGIVAATFPDYARGGRGVLRLLRTALRDAPEDLVPRLRRPMLVLRGDDDRISTEPWCARLVRAAPVAELRTLPGPHNVPYVHPGPVASAVEDFARRATG